MEISHILGVDPSFINLGLALMDIKKKEFVHLAKYDFNKATQVIHKFTHHYNFVVVLENPNLESNIFDAWHGVKNAVMRFRNGQILLNADPKGNQESVQSYFARAMKRAQSVGKNQAAAQQMIEFLDRQGIYHASIKPSERQRAYKGHGKSKLLLPVNRLKMPTKTTAEQFKQFTGHEGRSNEHSRDAGTLIYHLTIPSLNYLFQTQNLKK